MDTPTLLNFAAYSPDDPSRQVERQQADRANADLTTIRGFSKMIRSAIRSLWQPSGWAGS